MKLKSFRSISTGAAMALALAAVSAPAMAEEYPRMSLRVAHAFPSNWAQTEVDQWWADEISARSDGQIRINMMWAGAGGEASEILRLVGSGAVDMGAVPPAYFPNELPLTSAPNALPLTFQSNEAAVRVIEGIVAEVPQVREELAENNVWPLFFHTLNTYQPLCTKPVATMDDWDGLRIRTFGAWQPLLWESLGAVGVNVMTPEKYEGLQRGRIDCGFFSTDLYAQTKLYEVAKHLSSFGFGPQPTWPIWVNYERWHNDMPDNVKELIMEVSAEAQQRSLQAVQDARKSSLQRMIDAGVEVVEFQEPEALRAAAPDFRSIWLEAMKDEGRGEGAQAVYDYWMEHGDTP